MEKLFGTDGIRARAGEGPLEPLNVRKIARAIGYLLRKNPARFRNPLPIDFPGPRDLPEEEGLEGFVVLGRDTRESCQEIEEGLIDGLMTHNLPIASAGVVPTPGLAHLVRAWKASLGIMISASHNQAFDNGIKLISPDGLKVPDAAEARVEEIYFDKVFGTKLHRSDTVKIVPPKNVAEKTSAYCGWLVAHQSSLKGLKIVVDCANGAMSEYAPRVLREVGAKVVVLNDVPDGTNINQGCGALHPEGLKRAVLEERADAGVALDGDGDRAIFVDETGRVRDGDHVLAACATSLQERGKLPAPKVVSTLMANYGLELYLRERGIELLRAKVGDRFVVEGMLRSKAILGGEPSGHILFFDQAPTGDGLVTTMRFLSLLVGDGPLSKLCAGLRKLPQVILSVPAARRVPVSSLARSAVEKAEEELEGQGRIVVRYSGTEPVCRVMVEGEDRARVEQIARRVAEAVRADVT